MAPGARSAKRRKPSPPEDDASAAGTENSTPVPTPAGGTLKPPTRRAGLLSESTRASSRLAGRRGLADDLDDPDVYDDIDGAFGGSPARQLQSEAAKAVKRVEKPAEPKKVPRAKSRAVKQSDSQKENIPEDDVESVDEEALAPKPTRRARNTRAKADDHGVDAKHEEDEKTVSTPARARSGRAKAGEKLGSASKNTRSARKSQDDEQQELDEKLESAKKSAAKAGTPAKPRTASTKPPPEKTSLLDLLGNGDMSNEESSGDATPELVVSPVLKRRSQPQKAQPVSKSIKAVKEGDGHPPVDALAMLKARVLGQITGKESIPLVGLDDEYKKVHNLVEQTVCAGEGNSMLVIGARGSGKSALVNQVLKEISKDQRQDFHIIRLNGFIHTDDKLALREIWRQLGREMDVEDDTMGKNYADTLSTLLALLSHPSELAGQDSEEVAKAVIFLMDEFDLFASHPRQTLLYNLFDIAQSRKAPITVLGLTTRIGVSETLEKRVKSRFSHRYVHLSLAKSLNSFQEICKSALTLRPEDLSDSDLATLSAQSPSKSRSTPKSKQTKQPKGLLASWNDSIEVSYNLTPSTRTATDSPRRPCSRTPPSSKLTWPHTTTSKNPSPPPSPPSTSPSPSSLLKPSLSLRTTLPPLVLPHRPPCSPLPTRSSRSSRTSRTSRSHCSSPPRASISSTMPTRATSTWPTPSTRRWPAAPRSRRRRAVRWRPGRASGAGRRRAGSGRI